MRHFTLTIKLAATLLIAASDAFAQIPQYSYTNYPVPPGTALGSCGFSTDANAGIKYQCIFYPTDFVGMPKGAVKAIYIKVGRNITSITPYTYTNFRVKMGYTNDSTFPNNSNKIDSFKAGLTTVYGPANFTVTGIDSVGRWVRIPLNAGSFSFSPERKFVFEISRGAKVDGAKGFDIMMSNRGSGTAFKYRILGGYPDSSWAYTINAQINTMDFGMDLATTDVDGVENMSSFGLFPNPTTDGRFNISFETTHPVKEATIKVSSVTGQRILEQSYSGIGTTFFKEIKLPDVSKGMYFVEVLAGSDRIVRTVTVR